ncbi:alpha/beta-hydrolase [Lactarius quietus]|nr:alpha/beta-hydrolase [Lactarius quietus]
MATSEDAPQQQWLSAHDPATCARRGLCPVTNSKDHQHLEIHSLYFELHGTGPIKVIFIPGLNVSSNMWTHQVRHFSRLPQYSVLVFDNRGTGNSDTPKGPYSTSAMAEDVIVLLDFVEWTKRSSIHVVGLSMGGMIAQELASRIPERLLSLTLASTTAGGLPIFNLPPWVGFKNMLRIRFIKDEEKQTPYVAEMFFNSSWLDARAENDPEGRTNREVQIMLYNQGVALTPAQKAEGSASQMWAALTHHVKAKRLAQISKALPKVLILTGDQDHLVKSSNSTYLSKHMPEAELVVWKDTGHVVNMQHAGRFNTLLERVFHEGVARLEGRI